MINYLMATITAFVVAAGTILVVDVTTNGKIAYDVGVPLGLLLGVWLGVKILRLGRSL